MAWNLVANESFMPLAILAYFGPGLAQNRAVLSGIKISEYPTDGKIRHPA
jgi:hypothetical protein